MQDPSKEKMFYNDVHLYLTVLGYNVKPSNNADLTVEGNGIKTGYYLSRKTDKTVLNKAIENSENFDEIYLVFGDEKKYREIRNEIPKAIGIILYADLYGFGYTFLVTRKANKNGK